MKTLQAMVAGIVAARGTKAESSDGEIKTKTLEERLDAFSKPLPESKRYVLVVRAYMYSVVYTEENAFPVQNHS